MAEHEKINSFIRGRLRGHQTSVTSDDQLTNAEMNALIRQGKTLEQVKEDRKSARSKRKLSADETLEALRIMQETDVTWSAAKALVLQATAEAKPIDMNQLLRSARGLTSDELENGEEK